MVLICTRARINLFLQLSCSWLVLGITTTRRQPSDSSSQSPHHDGRIAAFAADSHRNFGGPVRNSPATSAANDEHVSQAGRKITAVGIRHRDEHENHEEPTTTNVLLRLWEKENQAGRKYLPPDRVAVSYGRAGLVVDGNDRRGSPLSTTTTTTTTTPGRYFTESWSSHWKNRASSGDRQRDDEKTPGKGAENPRDRIVRPTVEKTTRRRVAGHEDTRPVYEFINDDDDSHSASVDPASNDQRDYATGPPTGNRAREQSADPNAVTQPTSALLAVASGKPRRESTISRDAAAAERAALCLRHWFSTTDDDRDYGYGYNSPVHPPPNPVVSLVLSHYGRYLSGTHQPRYYSYMAVNNIHNNRPFGQYKLERDEEPGLQPYIFLSVPKSDLSDGLDADSYCGQCNDSTRQPEINIVASRESTRTSWLSTILTTMDPFDGARSRAEGETRGALSSHSRGINWTEAPDDSRLPPRHNFSGNF